MIAGKTKHGFHFLYHLIQNGKFSPRSPEQGNGGGSGYCCVYLPDGSASLAPTRNGQLIKDMLASLCEKRGFPLKDIVIYLHGKDKVGARLLCTHHYHWTEVWWMFKQTLVSFSTLLQQPLSLDQDCSVLRDQQVTLELRVKFAWVNTSFLLFFGLCHPSRHTHTHILNTARPLWRYARLNMSEFILDFLLKYYWGSAIPFTSGLHVDVKIALAQWG